MTRQSNMTQQSNRKGGGGKLARTQNVTIRLDPRLRYLADVAARKQRRTLSSFIEGAIEDALAKVVLMMDFAPGRKDVDVSVAALSDELWDVDEADRFVKLASRFPNLLTHDEERLWKLIAEQWGIDPSAKERPKPSATKAIRAHWQVLKNVNEGALPASALEKLNKTTGK